MNLVSNALKYSPHDSEVVLALSAVHDGVRVAVVDQGSGIAADELPRLFERFYRTQSGKSQQGLGLGLYIASMIVKAHGARLEVESEVGKGSTFHFTLPVATEPLMAAEEARRAP